MHTSGFKSLISVYATSKMWEADDNNYKFWDNLNSIFGRCHPLSITLIVLGDFSATTVTEKGGYVLCIGPHVFSTRNTNSSHLLN